MCCNTWFVVVHASKAVLGAGGRVLWGGKHLQNISIQGASMRLTPKDDISTH